MSRSAAETLTDALARPYDPKGASWDGQCILHTRVTGGLNQAGDAAPAMRKSTIVSTNASAAPIGAIHWFYNDRLADKFAGHLGRDISGGGRDILMTAARRPFPRFGDGSVGYSSAGEWLTPARVRAGWRYVGWSRDFAGQPLVITGTTSAGTGPTKPIDNTPPIKEQLMSIIVIDATNIPDRAYLVDDEYMVKVAVNLATGNAVRKLQKGEPMSTSELDALDWIGPHLVAARLSRHPSLKSATVDPAPIIAALKTAIAEQGFTPDFGPLEQIIAAGFAGVKANIDDSPADALAVKIQS